MAQIADHIAVMHQGTIVERGGRQQVFENPQHAHTRELLASAQATELAVRTAQPGVRT